MSLKVTEANIDRVEPNPNLFFIDEDAYHNFKRNFVAARNSLRNAYLYVREESDLGLDIRKLQESMDEIEVGDE
jgi:hypothetical protein